MGIRIDLKRATFYIDLLASIILGLFILLGAYYYWQLSQALEREDVLRSYHLKSSASLYSAYTHLSLIHAQFDKVSDGLEVASLLRVEAVRGLSNSEASYQDYLYLLDRDLRDVQSLQEQFKHPSFINVVSRLANTHAGFKSLIEKAVEQSSTVDMTALLAASGKLIRVIDQAKRLHARESNVLSKDLGAIYNKNFIYVFIISLILVCLIAYAYVMTRRLIRRHINRHDEAHRLLQQKKSEFEAMFHAIPDTIIYADMNRRIIMTNPAIETCFGYATDELLGLETKILYANPADYTEQGKQRYSKTETNTKPLYEMKYKRKDATTFIGETLASKIIDQNGQVVGFLALIRDITTRIQTENELKKFQQHLGELVDERTRELHAYMNELESFSYSITHDLRTPLRAIDGYSHLLSDEYAPYLDENAGAYLSRIRAAAQRMGRLIDDVLLLTKVTRSSVTCQEVDISALAKEIEKELKVVEPDHRVKFIVKAHLKAMADQTLLRLLLENLLGNAWKYTHKEADARVEFGAFVEDAEVIYFVKDNGVGFDMQFSSKLFKAFHRLHDVSDFPGTGIGLATVQRIVQRHGGRVWAEAEVGKGATFYFTLGENKTQEIDSPVKQTVDVE